MRISDWSSDVCSSDLGPRRQRHSPSVSGFAAATSPWLRHREDIFLSPQRLRAAVHLGVAAVRGARVDMRRDRIGARRSEEHTSELQSLMRISYAVFCLKKKKK